MTQDKITKVKLSDGNVYSFFDTGALRLLPDGTLVTGNEVVDNIILNGHLKIVQIDDALSPQEYIMVTNDQGNIMKRPRATFLKTDLEALAEVTGETLNINISDISEGD